MKQRDLIRKLEEAGYRLLRQSGDHLNYYHPTTAHQKLIQVPHHREINELLAKAILRDAGLR